MLGRPRPMELRPRGVGAIPRFRRGSIWLVLLWQIGPAAWGGARTGFLLEAGGSEGRRLVAIQATSIRFVAPSLSNTCARCALTVERLMSPGATPRPPDQTRRFVRMEMALETTGLTQRYGSLNRPGVSGGSLIRWPVSSSHPAMAASTPPGSRRELSGLAWRCRDAANTRWSDFRLMKAGSVGIQAVAARLRSTRTGLRA